MSSRLDQIPHSSSPKAAPSSPASMRRIWRLQYGPCWCQGLPGETGSFDLVRTSSREADLGDFGRNILILPDRVIDGSRAVFLRLYDQVPTPRLVVSTAACPSAGTFWSELPVGWSPVQDVVPVDIQVDDCASGHPEALIAALLSYASSDSKRGEAQPSASFITSGQEKHDAVAR